MNDFLPKWFTSLQRLPGYQSDPESDGNLLIWAERDKIDQAVLEQTVDAMREVLTWNAKLKCWVYRRRDGKLAHYQSLRRVLMNWVRAPERNQRKQQKVDEAEERREHLTRYAHLAGWEDMVEA